MDITLTGTFRMTRAALQRMQPRGKGVIVGLRYKRPKKVLEEAEKKSRFREGFVVPVASVEGRLIAAHTPKHDPAEFHDEDEAKMLNIMADFEEYGIDKSKIRPASKSKGKSRD